MNLKLGKTRLHAPHSLLYRMKAGKLVLGIFLAICSSFTPIAYAAEQAGVQIDIGLQNTYKIGCWTQATVQAKLEANRNYRTEIRVLDADGNYAGYSSPVTSASAVGDYVGHVDVIVNRIQSDFRILIFEATASTSEKLIFDQIQPAGTVTELTQHQPWLVTIGRVEGIEATAEFVKELQITTLSSIEELPQNPLAMAGIDVVLFGHSNESMESISQIISWVQVGGKLVIFPDQEAEKFLESSLASNLPINFERTAQVRDLSRVESFVGEASRLRTRNPLTIPRIVSVNGTTLVGGLTGPLVIKSPWGMGELTFCALSLNEDTFQNWEALPQLYRILADLPGLNESRNDSSSNLLTQTGLSDFKTQWDAGLSDFGLLAPNVWIPLSLLLATAFIVGPIDYFLVRHILKKPWLTWCTFPTLVVISVIWGLRSTDRQAVNAASAAEEKPGAIRYNQALVVDYAETTRSERHRQFTKMLIPETGRYDISVKSELPFPMPDHVELTTTSSVPEATYRGYYRNASAHLDQTSYQIQPQLGKVLRAPAHEQSTLLLEAAGMSLIDPDHDELETSFAVTSQLSSNSSMQVKGTIEHALSGELTDWFLAYDKLIYFVDEDHEQASLAPGEVLEFPSRSIRQRELSAQLTGTTQSLVKRKTGVGEKLMIRRVDYDLFSPDLDYILTIMTFHDLVGGKDYTKLTNIEFSNWDLSPLLALDQAVLIGRVETEEPAPVVKDETVSANKTVTFVRLIMPVDRNRSEIQRLPQYDK
ncbi:hypothetical protein [Rubinisphaera italica]|uniref:DUF4350 domain-containing protein n=1 Tax=Rubinisphaera italica TaxID=2527969 RepID=A0A5C5XCC1_9PLAN|nr:hypothetical protein [Rubinisphaera italica]TWT60091.1 hypothetical protein Pan54_08040 [Rubinisphaera italica]